MKFITLMLRVVKKDIRSLDGPNISYHGVVGKRLKWMGIKPKRNGVRMLPTRNVHEQEKHTPPLQNLLTGVV